MHGLRRVLTTAVQYQEQEATSDYFNHQLVTLLQQLCHLQAYAVDMFAEIAQELKDIETVYHRVNGRVDALADRTNDLLERKASGGKWIEVCKNDILAVAQYPLHSTPLSKQPPPFYTIRERVNLSEHTRPSFIKQLYARADDKDLNALLKRHVREEGDQRMNRSPVTLMNIFIRKYLT